MAGRVRFSLLGCLGIVVTLASWVLLIAFKTYRESSGSMEKTIARGDRLIMRRWREPKRGDIIVFDHPRAPAMAADKRLVGLPGEVVEIRDKQFFIDGRKIDEIYARHDDPHTYANDPQVEEPYRRRDQFGPAVVPADCFFVLGDNRDWSSDSRRWGMIPRDHVRGVVVLIISKRGIFPPD
jgi:signal peptidase I